MIGGFIKSFGKCFASKAAPIESELGRITSAVKLQGVVGNEAQRIAQTEALKNKFFTLVDDVFESKIKKNQQPVINDKEILGCFKKVLPNVKITIEPELRRNTGACLEPVLNEVNNKIVSYVLKIKGFIRKGVNEEDLRHEARHIFDYATQPKMLARTNTSHLVGKLEKYTPYKDSEHFGFYEDFLYAPRKYYEDRTELNMLKKNIKAHFGEFKSPPEEKIEVLQDWRHRLKTEINAYGDEAKFCGEKNLEKYLDDNYADFVFEPKLKLVEQLLKDEIAGAREVNAVKASQRLQS